MEAVPAQAMWLQGYHDGTTWCRWPCQLADLLTFVQLPCKWCHVKATHIGPISRRHSRLGATWPWVPPHPTGLWRLSAYSDKCAGARWRWGRTSRLSA